MDQLKRKSISEILKMFIFLGLLSVVRSTSVLQSHYVLNPICNIQERIDSGCATFISILRNSMECVSVCNQDDKCVGFSFSKQNECYFQKICPSTISCDQEDENFTHYVRSENQPLCFQDNRWDFEKGKCICRNGWIGEYCEELAHTCDQLAKHKYPLGDHHVTLHIVRDGSVLLNLTCVVFTSVSGSPLVLRHKGVGNLNRTWEEFVSGFEESDSVYWMGLENLYLLNQAGHGKLHLLLEMVGNISTHIRRVFRDFRITDASRGYTVSYTSATGSKADLGGCMDLEGNVRFSTWDSDNDDLASDNCASKHGAGWWYPALCDLPCNVMAYKAGDALQNIASTTMTYHFDTLYMILR